MAIKEITSLHNPLIQSLRLLEKPKGRREQGLLLAEGRKMTAEALEAGLCTLLLVDSDKKEVFAALIQQAEAKGIDVAIVSPAVMSGFCIAKSPQGIACTAKIPASPEKLSGNLLLALDGIQDPGNMGTILRTADAAGFEGVLLGEGCADPTGPKALQSTMGSVYRLPLQHTPDLASALAALRGEGYKVIASELGGGDFYHDLPSGPSVLVIGNEGNGISPAVSREATHHLALPMRGGAESLNAAVAAGIMMYEMSRDK